MKAQGVLGTQSHGASFHLHPSGGQAPTVQVANRVDTEGRGQKVAFTDQPCTVENGRLALEQPMPLTICTQWALRCQAHKSG